MNSHIPWIHGYDWEQVVQGIELAAPRIGVRAGTLKDLAEQITSNYNLVEAQQEKLCACSCTVCLDVCCVKATVWYDFKDLLYLYFATGGLPDRQIRKTDENCCCHLTPSGCSIARNARPFICSWYICAAQKQDMNSLSGEGRELLERLDQLKLLRKSLESRYISLACENLP